MVCAAHKLAFRDSLIDWISDTRSQGCTYLQSLVKCLDHRDIVSDTVCLKELSVRMFSEE